MTISLSDVRSALLVDQLPSSDYDLNPDYKPSTPTTLRDAAVLVGLFESSDGLRVVLTKRSSSLKHHPGQIAFPGGKKDLSDTNLVETALRESDEEIGLACRKVEVLGELQTHETVTNFLVQPILGYIRDDFEPVPEEGEVSEVFSVPFDFLADPDNYCVQSRLWRGHRRHYYVVPYGPYYIWGATARILRALAQRVQA